MLVLSTLVLLCILDGFVRLFHLNLILFATAIGLNFVDNDANNYKKYSDSHTDAHNNSHVSR